MSAKQVRVFVPQRVNQFAWLLFAAVGVSLLLAGIAPHARLAIIACQGPSCLTIQLSPGQLAVLQRAGLVLAVEDGRQLTAAVLFPAALCLLTAAYCIWRRPSDLAAVAGAWGLAALGVSEFVRALAQVNGTLHFPAEAIALVAAIGLVLCFCLIPTGRLYAAWIGWALAGLALLGAWVVFTDAGAFAQAALGIGALLLCMTSLLLQHRVTAGSPQQERVIWAIAALTLLAGAQLVGRPLRPLPLSAALPVSLPPEAYTMITINGMILAVGGVACLAVALLRDELFDVEIILNRALVYALLSIIIVACYVLVVGYLSLLFQGSGNLWLSLIATGVVAVLVHPLRIRVQRLVNQLLYGQRAEPYAVVADFGRQLESSLAPEAVLPAIVETVAGALRLPYVVIVLGAGEVQLSANAYGAPPPATSLTAFPLVYLGAEVGRLLVAPRTGEADLSDTDRRLLADLARQAGVAAHTVQLTLDLRRSRQQLVNAREDERRRLRRDLHDGLGPTLASQALTIDTVELLLDRDPTTAVALLREVKSQSQVAVADIRRLVYGLRPPALDDLGLVGALREQTRRLAGSGVDVLVEAAEPLPPLPAAVEVAAYRIAQEALANVMHHARAHHCTVALAVSDALTLTVSDDGVGIPPGRTAGVGLSSMRERTEELGGNLVLETNAGGGTTVHARLPLGGKSDDRAD